MKILTVVFMLLFSIMTVCGYMAEKELHKMAIGMNTKTLFLLPKFTDKNKIVQRVSDPMALAEICNLLVLNLQ